MGNLEHYFENLLYHGQDVSGDVNKNALTAEEQNAVEVCAAYVKYTMCGGDAVLLDAILHDNVEPVRHGHKVIRNRPLSSIAVWVKETDDGSLRLANDIENAKRLVISNRLERNFVAYCSECGKRLDDCFQNYCPNCGARIDGDEHDS